MTTQMVALMRGINVGKAKRIAMADLRAALTAAGYANVRTLLQSGNVVLDCAEREVSDLATDVARIIADDVGVSCPVLTRTAAQWADAIAADPLGEVSTDDKLHLVIFLDGVPDPALAANLTGRDYGEDRIEIRGTHAYLWCPRGVLASPVSALATEKTLGVTGTSRNWATVNKIAALLDA